MKDLKYLLINQIKLILGIIAIMLVATVGIILVGISIMICHLFISNVFKILVELV